VALTEHLSAQGCTIRRCLGAIALAPAGCGCPVGAAVRRSASAHKLLACIRAHSCFHLRIFFGADRICIAWVLYLRGDPCHGIHRIALISIMILYRDCSCSSPMIAAVPRMRLFATHLTGVRATLSATLQVDRLTKPRVAAAPPAGAPDTQLQIPFALSAKPVLLE